jgi:hypothetical protein
MSTGKLMDFKSSGIPDGDISLIPESLNDHILPLFPHVKHVSELGGQWTELKVPSG